MTGVVAGAVGRPQMLSHALILPELAHRKKVWCLSLGFLAQHVQLKACMFVIPTAAILRPWLLSLLSISDTALHPGPASLGCRVRPPHCTEGAERDCTVCRTNPFDSHLGFCSESVSILLFHLA